MEHVHSEMRHLFAPVDIARWSLKRKLFNFRRDTELSYPLYPLGNNSGSKSLTKCRRENHLLTKDTFRTCDDKPTVRAGEENLAVAQCSTTYVNEKIVDLVACLKVAKAALMLSTCFKKNIN